MAPDDRKPSPPEPHGRPPGEDEAPSEAGGKPPIGGPESPANREGERQPADAAGAMPSAVTPAEAEARASTGPSDPTAMAAVLQAARGSGGALPRRRWFGDLPDRGLFILFLLAGTAAVLALKLALEDARLATWVATAAASATLLGYAALASRFRMPGDRLGDNCYYLGFLLTLASMAAALIQFDISADERGPVLERLIGSFGIALFSTFLGIALRVVFLQMRRELDDLEEATRQELEARAELLKGQLLQAVTELESFRLRTRQVLEERLMQAADTVRDHLDAQAEEGLRLVRRLADEGSRALGVHSEQALRLEAAIRAQTEAAAALAERLGHVEVPPDLFRQEVRLLAERLAASFTPLEQAVAALAGRITAMEVPADLVTARLDPFAVALVRATEALQGLAEAEARRLAALDDALARLTRAIEVSTHRDGLRHRGRVGWLARLFGRRQREG